MDVVEEARKWTPVQVTSELVVFAEWCAMQQIREVLEIGVHHGGTTVFFLELGCMVTSIDLPDGPHGGLSALDGLDRNVRLRQQYPGDQLRMAIGDSHDPLMREAVAERRYDLIFVDGDHSPTGVRQDWTLYHSLVRPGGWMAFHDITPDTQHPEYGVPAFWNGLDGEKLSITDATAGWGGIGIIKIGSQNLDSPVDSL